MNCKKGTSSGKFFAETFVCPDCHAVATRLYEQGVRELNQVLLTLKEFIRVSIVEGRMSFAPPPEGPDGTSQPHRAIDAIVDMMKTKQCHDESSRQSTVSVVPTRGVAGLLNSNSTQDSTSTSETPSTQPKKGGLDIA